MLPPFITLLIGSYAILDSLSTGLGESQRLSYSVVCLLTAIAIVVKRPSHGFSVLNATTMRLWLFASLVGFVMIAFQPNKHTLYILGDAASFSYTLLLGAVASRYPEVFFSSNSRGWLCLMLFGAMCAAPFFPSSGSSRFREPQLMLAALLWVHIATERSPRRVAIASAAMMITVAVTLFSGARFVLMLSVGMGAALVMAGHATKAIRYTTYACSLLAMLFAVFGALSVNSLDSVEHLRVVGLVQKVMAGDLLTEIIEDGSMHNRFLESDDALYTRWHSQHPIEWVLGSGHGAVFDTTHPIYSDRPLEDGSVHHIHFGLVLLYYRYGVQGLLIYASLLIGAVTSLLEARRLDRDSPQYKSTVTFSIAALAYLANLLICNQLVDPILSYAFAGLVAVRAARSPMRKRSSVHHRNRLLGARYPVTGRPRPI